MGDPAEGNFIRAFDAFLAGIVYNIEADGVFEPGQFIRGFIIKITNGIFEEDRVCIDPVLTADDQFAITQSVECSVSFETCQENEGLSIKYFMGIPFAKNIADRLFFGVVLTGRQDQDN